MAPILEARGVTKVYPGTVALKEVDFDVFPGEVHALIGENGAGKSTLMKILAGEIPHDAGKMMIQGEELHFGNPKEARAKGVTFIHQELNLK